LSVRWGDSKEVIWNQVTSVTLFDAGSDDKLSVSRPRQRWLTIGFMVAIALVAISASIGIATIARWLFA